MSIANDDGKWGNGQKNVITRIGKFLRKSRIDELPQLWNVVRGDISLVGPRPEFPEPVALYTKEIPYYNLRHIVKPGLSGWAQIYHQKHPHHGIDTEETGNKLSYDLYYIKNRSFLLDLKIALRTMKVLLSFAGK
jgi:lipopolysaccharide/colanic/teichoic acid biosynthesis glycosyltransferase